MPALWPIVVGPPCHMVCLLSITPGQGLDLDLSWNHGFSPSFQGKLLFPSIFQVGSTWNHQDNNLFLYDGWHHQHANGQSPTIICHQNKLFWWVFWCHWNAVWWKDCTASTIMVLSLWWLGKEFPSHTYHLYYGTIIHSSHHRSRLIAVWWVPWYPSHKARYDRYQA